MDLPVSELVAKLFEGLGENMAAARKGDVPFDEWVGCGGSIVMKDKGGADRVLSLIVKTLGNNKPPHSLSVNVKRVDDRTVEVELVNMIAMQ